MSEEENLSVESTDKIKDNKGDISAKKADKPESKVKIFSLIETLGMYCLYAGVACLIISYFAKYGFTFTKLTRDQIVDLLVWGARGGLVFALVIGLPIWLAREYGQDGH